MSTLHGWSGSPAVRVAVQLPPAARAGVVVVPPLGQEGVIAYRTLRLLADRLEAGPRRAIGWALVTIGVASTLPLAIDVLGKIRRTPA